VLIQHRGLGRAVSQERLQFSGGRAGTGCHRGSEATQSVNVDTIAADCGIWSVQSTRAATVATTASVRARSAAARIGPR
jgi:hypothetical protein